MLHNQLLSLIRQQVTLFQAGKISLSQMWDAIEKDLDHTLNGGEDVIDPFEDDKTERWTPIRLIR